MPERIAQYCNDHLNLRDAELGEEYCYQSLPFCIIDAVYSIGARYSSTTNVVKRFCKTTKLPRLRTRGSPYPDIAEQCSVRQFEALLSGYDDYLQVAATLFNNRQRTSTRNGILKAEAVHWFSLVLVRYNVNYFQDIQAVISNSQFECDIRNIPGQTYGTSLKYFFMLAGEENMVKPDRLILRFLNRITGNDAGKRSAHDWLSEALKILNQAHPTLTLRKLDHEIWKHERSMMNQSKQPKIIREPFKIDRGCGQ